MKNRGSIFFSVIQCLFFVFGILSLGANLSAQVPAWQDPHLVAKGKSYPCSDFYGYENEALAKGGRKESSSYFQSLNGVWKFHWVPAYAQMPTEEALQPGYDDTAWKEIPVPGNWERNGFGTAIYTNDRYEFMPENPQPPLLPQENPVGTYRKKFEIPASWQGRDIFVRLDAVKSGCYLFINGKEVGYGEDSKNPADFDITPYVSPGENTIALRVFRWSTGSYLECQDFWRLSGIERGVSLFARPKSRISDFEVESSLDTTYQNGEFLLRVQLSNHQKEAVTQEISYRLISPSGEICAQESQSVQLSAGGKEELLFQKILPRVMPWSAEHAVLYRLEIRSLIQDEIVEIIPYRVGFRRVEIRGSQFLLNGKPILIKGVNIHEHHPITAHVVDEQTLITDFRLMKSLNINAIRCSHYPQQERFYELCDEYGFYVCDEANIESHGMFYDLSKGATLGNDNRFYEAHLDRTINMYERNKNHPSILFWSLGNEGGNGYNFYRTYLWLKERERSRPVQYERALWEWNTDIFCPQYPGAKLLKEWGERGTDRPVIASEYSHAINNGLGNLYDQWVEIYRYPNLQGGFIWDWCDQALLETDSTGTPYWAYGGDYGEKMPSNGSYLINGIVTADRQLHPGTAEVKKVYQNVWFIPVDLAQGVVRMENRFDFTALSDFRVRYTVAANDRIIRRGVIPSDLAPGKADTLRLNLKGLTPQAGVSYFLNFYVEQKKATSLLPKHYLVATEQFCLPIAAPKKRYQAPKTNYAIRESDSCLWIESEAAMLRFNRIKGCVDEYRVSGVSYLEPDFGLQPNFWRAPTCKDYGYKLPLEMQWWKTVTRQATLDSISVEQQDESVTLRVYTDLAEADSKCLLAYTLYGDGKLHVKQTVSVGHEGWNEPPRIGVRFRMPHNDAYLHYFGRGPQENYCDRNEGTLVGLYRGNASDQYYPYVRPQENGHKTDVRWLTLTTSSPESGLAIIADSLLEFNAMPYAVEDFDAEEIDRPYQWRNFSKDEDHSLSWAKNRIVKQVHTNDVKKCPFVEVCLDYRMQGVGGDDSWGARPYDAYRIAGGKTYSWGFTLIPIATPEAVSSLIKYQYQPH